MVKHPTKWRETIDPFSLKLKDFQIMEILGYPHAGNDVFHVLGKTKDNLDIEAYLKVERQKTADIEREILILQRLNLAITPNIIDFSLKTPKYLLTQAIEGERLSTIVGDNKDLVSLSYLEKYAELLAKIHDIKLDFPLSKVRDFMLADEFYLKNNFEYIKKYLMNTKPNDSFCFIHGDCHYANILWENNEVSGLLDFELAGCGSREYDLAWALVIRPGQKFLRTQSEIELFLTTYLKYHDFCRPTFNYYLVLFNIFFYKISLNIDYDDNNKFRIKIINKVLKNID